MSEKRRTEKNFPLLRPYPTAEEAERAKRHDPLFWGELQRLEGFADLVLQEKKRKKKVFIIAQALRDIFGARGENEKIYRALNQSLQEARQAVKDIILKIPKNFSGVFNSEGQIAEERDFISLLEKRKKSFEDGGLGKMREFEARRLIVFTLILFHLNLHSQKLHLKGASLQAVTQYLERRFFDKGEVHRKTIFALHNLNDESRVGSWYFKEDWPSDLKILDGWKLKKHEMLCRQFSLDGNYLIYFSCREKTPLSHLLKMLRRDIRDPFSSALDWRGFKLVFFNEQALEAGLEKLRRDVFYLPAVTWKLEDGRFFKETLNIFSSKRFRAKKFVTTIGGESAEVIMETLTNHLNGIASLGEENHELYRLRQLVKSALPLVFPFDLYGINWEEKEEEIIEVYKKTIEI
jgi:hypothetical protein